MVSDHDRYQSATCYAMAIALAKINLGGDTNMVVGNAILHPQRDRDRPYRG